MKNWKFRKIHHDILIVILHFCISMMAKKIQLLKCMAKIHSRVWTLLIEKEQERNTQVTKRISLSKNPSPDSTAIVGIARQFCSPAFRSVNFLQKINLL